MPMPMPMPSAFILSDLAMSGSGATAASAHGDAAPPPVGPAGLPDPRVDRLADCPCRALAAGPAVRCRAIAIGLSAAA